MTRNPLKWHPVFCQELEIFNTKFRAMVNPQSAPSRWVEREVKEEKFDHDGDRILWEFARDIPTWSGEWQRRFLLAEGFTEEEITAATCLARMMGETI